MKKQRCAIYTRKSSEEGLDQAFNSLDAQREACEAFVASQKSEGWIAIRAAYDDGGWSGGSIERPALKRLLADIAAGLVDIVIVYKVDRLTRSLADFARMVDLFDRHQVSFVSVTQAFNTTSSMGRLTLNVLLSFAQFEREVTGERIRDKIAASKAKGMWMGGYPPLGYDPKERTLSINPAEAAIVRHIFNRYLALGSVHALARELEAEGVRSKAWTSASGIMRGGVPISRGTLFHMLRNRLYLGEIVHKDKSHPGQHEAIVEAELFAAVQVRLSKNTVARRDRTTTRAPLTALLFDAVGHRMSPTHARGRLGQRYLYYVSAPLLAGEAAPAAMVRRVAARAIEGLVLDRLRRWAGRPHEGWAMFLPWLRRIELHRRLVLVDLQLPSHERWSDEVRAPESAASIPGGILRITVPATIRTRGGGSWLLERAGASRKARPDRALIAGLRRAHAELKERGIDLTDPRPDFSSARGMGDPYLRKLSSLAFLAPDIQRAILKGRQPSGLTLGQLLSADVPLDWSRQRAMFGFDV